MHAYIKRKKLNASRNGVLFILFCYNKGGRNGFSRNANRTIHYIFLYITIYWETPEADRLHVLQLPTTAPDVAPVGIGEVEAEEDAYAYGHAMMRLRVRMVVGVR